MTNRLAYCWRLFERSGTIALSWLGLSGARLSFGVWIRYTRDSPHPNRVTASKSDSFVFPDLQYENSIRIFNLEPGKRVDPICGTLEERKLEELESKYEALSYAWGNTEVFTTSVQLSGKSLPITENLENALRELRSETETKALWIDAISINQKNNEEKGQQISKMHGIYQMAKFVIVWLGQSTAVSAVGLEVLSFLTSEKDFSDKPPWEIRSPTLLAEGLKDILHRPYFSRLWVIQETALAREIRMFVGREFISWRAGGDTGRLMARIKLAELWPSWEQAGLLDVDMQPLIQVLEHSLMALEKRSGVYVSPRLLDFAHNLRSKSVSDARDKIFSLLALDPESLGQDYQPDYGLPKEQLFTSIGARLLAAYEEGQSQLDKALLAQALPSIDR